MPTMKERMKKSVSLYTFCIFDPPATHWIGLTLVLCMMIFGCSDDPETDIAVVEQRQRDGWAAYDKGDFSAALLHFERVIELDVTRGGRPQRHRLGTPQYRTCTRRDSRCSCEGAKGI